MAKIFKWVICFTVGFLSLPSLSNTESINGIASYSELGSEVFIAALYTDIPTRSTSAFLETSTPHTFVIKFTAVDGVSSRRFLRQWVEGVAINNKPEQLRKYAPATVQFSSLLPDRFEYADSLTLAYRPGVGLNVILNQIPVGTVEQEKLFSLLMSAWLGLIPLSTSSKSSLLAAGELDSELLNRFSDVNPTRERLDFAYALSLSLQKEDEVESNHNLPPQTESQPSKEPAVIAIARPKKPVESKVTIAKEPKVLETDIKKKSKSTSDSRPYTVESLLANQRYVSEVNKMVRTKVKYPKKSLRLGEEGSVRIFVRVNRSGKVVGTDVVLGSPYSRLNTAAVKAVKTASPYPAVPDSILGEFHEFTVPITFQVSDS